MAAAHEDICTRNAEFIVGRDTEVDAVRFVCYWQLTHTAQLELIREYIQKPSADVAPLFVVSGGPGSGKTTLLSALSKKGEEWNCKIFFFHCTDANGEATGSVQCIYCISSRLTSMADLATLLKRMCLELGNESTPAKVVCSN